MIVRCPKCEKRYRVSDEAAGKRLTCRDCETTILVPASAPDQDEPAPSQSDTYELQAEEPATPDSAAESPHGGTSSEDVDSEPKVEAGPEESDRVPPEPSESDAYELQPEEPTAHDSAEKEKTSAGEAPRERVEHDPKDGDGESDAPVMAAEILPPATKKATDDSVSICWFCKGYEPVEACKYEMVLRNPVNVSEEQTIDIPRCPYCKRNHGEAWMCMMFGAVGGFAVGLIMSLVFWYLPYLPLATFAGLMAGFTAQRTYALDDAIPLLAGGVFGGFAFAWLGSCISSAITDGSFFVGFVLSACGVAWLMKKKLLRIREFQQVCPTVPTQPEVYRKLFPRVQSLMDKGWDEVMGGDVVRDPLKTVRHPWHDKARRPGRLFDKKPPNRCPVCGGNMSTSVASFVGSVTVGPDIQRSVQCCRCGAWGCTLCAHHHHKNHSANTYVSEDVSDTHQLVYQNIQWVHDACCNCKETGVEHRRKIRPKHLL